MLDPQPKRRSVLVPVDFSPRSTAALLFASQLVHCARLPLLILHVIHESCEQTGFYRKHDASRRVLTLPPIEDVAQRMMQDFLSDLRKQHPDHEVLKTVRTLLVSGLPAKRIAEVASQENAVMIVMGSHGRTGLSHLLLGSVAEQVTRHSRIPVTIIKYPQGGSEGSTTNTSTHFHEWLQTSKLYGDAG